MRNPNRPITSTEIETVIKKLPTNRSEFFTGEFYQTLRVSSYPSETLAKNYRGRNTPKLMLRDHHHPDTKTRQIIQKENYRNSLVVQWLKINPPANAGDTGSIPGSGRFCMPWGN